MMVNRYSLCMVSEESANHIYLSKKRKEKESPNDILIHCNKTRKLWNLS